MILLEFGNRIIEEQLRQRMEVPADARKAADITIADFDGALFHLRIDPGARNLVTVSLQWACYPELEQYGASANLNGTYGGLATSPEPGYDYSVCVDLDNVPEPGRTPKKVAMMKVHAFAAPFKSVFEAVCGEGGSVPAVVTVNYRHGEALYLKSEGDGVTAVFSISFDSLDDQVLGHVFLQAMQDARRSITAAPAVRYTVDPPDELRGVPGVVEGTNQNYATIRLFKQHIAKQHRQRTIFNLQTFRNYLHYHLKCSKAFLHVRMRKRVVALLKVLNRAKIEKESEKKTITGRTFKRR